MTNLNNIIKRAMSLMKAHVQYSQNLAAEFSHLIKDYEVLIESPAEIVPAVQEEVDLEAVCAKFEELMENEPIDLLRALRPIIAGEPVERSDGELIINNLPVDIPGCIEEIENIQSMNVMLPFSSEEGTLFKCSICDKQFAHRYTLNRHRKVHSQERPYECTICSKRFGHKWNLKSHIQIHTGEKPFECSFCGKGFGQKREMENHTRVHTGEKPYECSVCSRRFSHNHSLKWHARVHTKDKPL
jgi:DNA-directed RNA polymerase subunit RPC12/RpoP